MSSSRRGNVSFPHRPQAGIKLHRVDGFPISIYLKDISCFEEHPLNLFHMVTTVYFSNGSNVVVREDFDAINKACRNWEVENV